MDKAELSKQIRESPLGKANPKLAEKTIQDLDADPWSKIDRRDELFETEFEEDFYMYDNKSIEFYTIRLAYDTFSMPYSGQLGHIVAIKDREKKADPYRKARDKIAELFTTDSPELEDILEKINNKIDMLTLTPATLKKLHKDISTDLLLTSFSNTKTKEIVSMFHKLIERDPTTEEKSFKDFS